MFINFWMDPRIQKSSRTFDWRNIIDPFLLLHRIGRRVLHPTHLLFGRATKRITASNNAKELDQEVLQGADPLARSLVIC